MADKTTIAIVPARGGSKGIPGKNIRPLGGKPLLAWSVEQAQRTPHISRVFVSTDSAEIASVARQFEAEVITRPPEISGDTASTESSLVHALDCLKAKENLEPDLVVFLQATSPIRESDDIRRAMETMEREGADSLFSACRVEGFTWRLAGGAVAPVNYNPAKRPLRQHLKEEIWEENGSFYIFKPSVLRKFNSRLGGRIAMHKMERAASFQIDEPADFELVEHLMAQRTTSASDGQAPVLNPQLSTLKQIKLLVLDFDGVLTDNRVLVMEDGREAVFCNRGDGLGLEMLKRIGTEVIVLSKEKNVVVSARCRKLGLRCVQGCDNKLAALQEIARDRSLESREIAYVGNDMNDLECLRWAGWPIAVSDAIPEVRSVAKWITSTPGGHGAVREVCELLLKNSVGDKEGETTNDD